jgi:hypothetical protein
MLSIIALAIAATPLPSEQELGFALAFSRRCVDSDGFTLCGPQPAGAKFKQYLCVEYGSDLARRVIVRCVYKGAQMIMPSRRGVTLVDSGDGAIDVTRDAGGWVPYN